MNKIKGFENAKPFTDTQNVKLPTGGYIIEIQDVEELIYNWGNVLNIKFDIVEGEFKNYYTNQYKNSQLENKKYKGNYRLNVPKDDGSDLDELTMRKFKSEILAIEESNNGFHWAWNEKELKGKKVGAIFFEKEWEIDNNSGLYVTVHSFRNIETIKNGKYKIPEPKLLKNKTIKADIDFSANATNVEDDDLPF